jgi:hypothetical protein
VRNEAGINSSYSDNSAEFRLPFDRPGIPKKLAPLEIGVSHAWVALSPPDDDGGKPVLEYELEIMKLLDPTVPPAKDLSSTWVLLARLDAEGNAAQSAPQGSAAAMLRSVERLGRQQSEPDSAGDGLPATPLSTPSSPMPSSHVQLKYRVDGLVSRRLHMLRVRCRNQVGWSDFRQMTMPIVPAPSVPASAPAPRLIGYRGSLVVRFLVQTPFDDGGGHPPYPHLMPGRPALARCCMSMPAAAAALNVLQRWLPHRSAPQTAQRMPVSYRRFVHNLVSADRHTAA